MGKLLSTLAGMTVEELDGIEDWLVYRKVFTVGEDGALIPNRKTGAFNGRRGGGGGIGKIRSLSDVCQLYYKLYTELYGEAPNLSKGLQIQLNVLTKEFGYERVSNALRTFMRMNIPWLKGRRKVIPVFVAEFNGIPCEAKPQTTDMDSIHDMRKGWNGRGRTVFEKLTANMDDQTAAKFLHGYNYISEFEEALRIVKLYRGQPG